MRKIEIVEESPFARTIKIDGKSLEVKWEKNMQKDLEAMHRINFKDEVAAMVISTIEEQCPLTDEEINYIKKELELWK